MAAAMAGGVDGYCWELNQLGHLFASGKPWPVQMRSAVIRLKEASDADKLAGGRGQTWKEIAAAAGGPTVRTCQNIWQRNQATGEVVARPTQLSRTPYHQAHRGRLR